jgi:hypothetical protein
MIGGVGTAVTTVGAVILLVYLATKALDPEVVLTGALLVLCGLVLRIGVAVWGSSGRGGTPGRDG